ncbi:MAG TPA: ABC-F family ATP-binding cassette domain-containing protein [Parachlamydiaceae bacterium]|nr:ABC-F family ATP-binding cassette domain-containing protein [Parachlamydiaceae bacterium]
MTALLTLHSLSKAHGTAILFENISTTISQGDKIGLLGPNGAGKSTLLKILIGEEKEDSGFISKKQGLVIGYASQSPEFEDAPLEEILTAEIPKGDETETLTLARTLLAKAQFTDYSQSAAKLSGGWKKRLDIARALMKKPDLLLLDEPTNHLDLEGILWLEKFLNREKTAYLVVSHDRYFLENTCSKIIELNRCYKTGLFISDGSLELFYERKEAFLKAELQYERGLSSKVRDEIAWLKRSPKARTTKSRARIEKASTLISELSDVKSRNKINKVDLNFSASERETRKLLTAKNISKSLGKELFSNLDITLSPGTRLGIVGKNGTGKTTLLKILAGMVTQDAGTIKYADNLKLVYFDQHRENISNDASLRRALSPTSDVVNYRGQEIHVNGWAKKFLFSEERLEMPVKFLSGGERARILIAKLMLEPADILFLDEPTNDLDIQTLEVMEESLKEFSGAIVLISHDRCLMDNVCTTILGLGKGKGEFFADYAQWEEALASAEKNKVQAARQEKEVKKPNPSLKKLSYNEQRELAGMEEAIIKAENKILTLQKLLEAAETIKDPKKSLEAYKELADAEKVLEALFIRWEELSEKNR